MPDRELPDHLKDRLSAALTSGAPLRSPLPSQARYAIAAGAAAPKAHLRVRLLTSAAAAFAIVALVVAAGPQQPREWILQTVGNLAKGVGAPIGPSTPSPSPEKHTPAASHSPAGSPEETSPSPETPEATESPEASPSPEPSHSPEGEPSPSSTAQPSDGGGGGDHSTASPSPTSDSGDGH